MNAAVSNNVAVGATVDANSNVASVTGGLGEGGGIYNDGGTIVIQNSTISGNQAVGGGATVYPNHGASGTAEPYGGAASGGGIFIDPSNPSQSLTLTGCTVSGNKAVGGYAYNNYSTAGGYGGNATGGGRPW